MLYEYRVGTLSLACIAHRLTALRTCQTDLILPLFECLFVYVFEWLLYACLDNVIQLTDNVGPHTIIYQAHSSFFFSFLRKKVYSLYVQPWSND